MPLSEAAMKNAASEIEPPLRSQNTIGVAGSQASTMGAILPSSMFAVICMKSQATIKTGVATGTVKIMGASKCKSLIFSS